MTISTTYSADNYAGNDATTVFAITFNFLSVSTNVKVSLKNDTTGVVTAQTVTTHYTISGSNVTMLTAPATGETLILELNPDFKQQSDYRENGEFPAETLETDLDERTLEGQINKDNAANSLKVDAVTASNMTSTTIVASGTAATNADKIVKFDSAGTGFEISTAAALGAVTLPVSVANGGTGTTTLTDGGVLLGSGTGAITQMAALADGEMIVGDGTTDPVAESGATLRTSIGVGTGDSPQFTGIELGHATDTTITRAAAGQIAIEGVNAVTISSTDTLTNKTIDANGTGNSISNIDIADLANGTDGELITWDAAGAPAAVAVGTATHVLTSNGAGAAPTFQVASGGISAASQAEQETGTEAAKYVAPLTQQFHQSACKAWLKMTGTGTPAIDVSYNTTSITDIATGEFTWTIATDFSSADYAVTGLIEEEIGGGGFGRTMNIQNGEQAAGTVNVITAIAASSTVDVSAVHLSAFGDQA